MKSDNVVMENNKFDKRTIQFVSSKLARCLLCKSSFIENLDDHIDGEQHQKNLKDPLQLKFLKSFHDGWCNVSIELRLIHQVYFLPYSETQIECCICEEYVNCEELMAHLKTHQELYYPRLIHWCDYCEIPYSDDELTSHLTDRKHELNVYEYNLRQLRPTEYLCDICDIVLQRNEYKKHIKQDYHATNLEYDGIKSLRNNSEDDSSEQSLNENLAHCDICDIVLFRNEFQEHMRSSYHRRNHDKLSKTTKIKDSQIQCVVCRVIVLREEFQAHIVGFCHQEHSKLFSLKHKEEKIDNKQDEAAGVPQFVSNVYKFPLIPSTGLTERDDSKVAEMVMKKIFLCHVCNIPFIKNNLEQHIMTKEHKTVLKQLNNLIKKDSKMAEQPLDNWNCIFRKKTVIFDIFQEHIYIYENENTSDKEQEHLQMILNKLLENSDQNEIVPNEVDKKPGHNRIECHICKIQLKRDRLQEHINEKGHLTILTRLISKKLDEIECGICNILFNSSRLKDHIEGFLHRKNMELLMS